MYENALPFQMQVVYEGLYHEYRESKYPERNNSLEEFPGTFLQI